MTGRKNPEHARRGARIGGVILLCALTRAALAANYFVPSVDLSGTWTNNIMLGAPGQEQAGELADLSPQIQFAHESPREQASLTYKLDALFFNPGGHDLIHYGCFISRLDVIHDCLELDVSGNRAQGVANLRARSSTAYLF